MPEEKKLKPVEVVTGQAHSQLVGGNGLKQFYKSVGQGLLVSLIVFEIPHVIKPILFLSCLS